MTRFGSADLHVSGTAHSDVHVSGNGNDEISGLDGDDLLAVGAGNDIVFGDQGNDTVQFASGDTGYDVIGDVRPGIDFENVIELEAAIFERLLSSPLRHQMMVRIH